MGDCTGYAVRGKCPAFFKASADGGTVLSNAMLFCFLTISSFSNDKYSIFKIVF